jgi:hypothetical protein
VLNISAQFASSACDTPSVNIFPTSLAAMTVSMRGSTYCMSPVASSIITVKDMVIRAMPPVMAVHWRRMLLLVVGRERFGG